MEARAMRLLALAAGLALWAAAGRGGEAAPAGQPAAPAARADPLKTDPEDLKWWREARFGMFIHWGPVSLTGKEIGWSRGSGAQAQEYDGLYKKFDPVKFDAKEWVAIAQAAGMKYLVFTTKHHDGFCEFDSKLTDYKITNSPFKRDVSAELAEACHQAGLRLGFYYSPTDFYQRDLKVEGPRYVQYMHGQVRELCSNYGQVDVLWFDEQGGGPWDSEKLFRMIRGLQPRVLINNRVGLPGDFDTPEQGIGGFQTGRAWESCFTICNQWAWAPRDPVKPLKQCIDTLVRCAGGDGNLLLNVGPAPTGEIEPAQVARLKEIGGWLKKYGETIYGTRGGPVMPSAWGACTHKGNTAYLHILNPGARELRIPPLTRKLVRSSVLTGGQASVEQTADGLVVSVPAESLQELDTIVALEFDGPVADIAPVKMRSGSAAFGGKAGASNVYRGEDKSYGAGKAFDDDPDTRWATDETTTQAWLGVDLEKPATVDRALISEYADRVQGFEVQYRDGDAWKTCARGTKIGANLELKFEPVTARQFRLLITKAQGGPSIWEFRLLTPRK
jgi:alpha-L-fucosidase